MDDFGRESWPTSRKPRPCEWCWQTIPAGERHFHFVGRWQGDWQDWRMHAECLRAKWGCGNDEGEFVPGDNPRGGCECGCSTPAGRGDEVTT